MRSRFEPVACRHFSASKPIFVRCSSSPAFTITCMIVRYSVVARQFGSVSRSTTKTAIGYLPRGRSMTTAATISALCVLEACVYIHVPYCLARDASTGGIRTETCWASGCAQVCRMRLDDAGFHQCLRELAPAFGRSSGPDGHSRLTDGRYHRRIQYLRHHLVIVMSCIAQYFV